MKHPRFLIAAPSSGSGKTTVTCGILQALVDRGMKVSSFKCGPDYIDPMFHSRVIGTESKNLDAFFCDNNLLRYLFARSAEETDISVIEGVMGFYDGISIASSEASSYDVAKIMKAPVILVVDCKGASVSCIPIIKGFVDYVGDNNIKGVILNRMSKHVHDGLKTAIEEQTGIEVIGYVPKLDDIAVESRHLGLVMPDEIVMLKEKLSGLAGVLEKTLNIDRLIELAENVEDLEYDKPSFGKLDGTVRIGLARDEAFCFTYEDNLSLLKDCGAEIVEFSPLNDEKLPDDIHGLIFSGGYPELHGEKLGRNASMLKDIKEKLDGGMPCLAESGGFMYLHEELEGIDGKMYRMVGFVKGKCTHSGKLSRFGYVTLSPGENQMLPQGSSIKGHEFHYWNTDNDGDGWQAERTSGRRYGCIHGSESLMLGFPHVFYYSNPELPHSFLVACNRHAEK